jgi:hypothetical protein
MCVGLGGLRLQWWQHGDDHATAQGPSHAVGGATVNVAGMGGTFSVLGAKGCVLCTSAQW